MLEEDFLCHDDSNPSKKKLCVSHKHHCYLLIH